MIRGDLMILVSACLAGLEVRYNGTHSLDDGIMELMREKKAIAVCPELLGGFQHRGSLLR